MLLESRIHDRALLVFDCESVGGIDKGGVSVLGHPDRIVPSTVAAIHALAESFVTALDGLERPPTGVEVRFGVRIDSNAIVQIARAPEQGQFQVTLRYG